MDKKSKLFFIFFGLLTLLSVGTSFYRYIVLKDVIIFENEDKIPSVIDNFEENLISWKI